MMDLSAKMGVLAPKEQWMLMGSETTGHVHLNETVKVMEMEELVQHTNVGIVDANNERVLLSTDSLWKHHCSLVG